MIPSLKSIKNGRLPQSENTSGKCPCVSFHSKSFNLHLNMPAQQNQAGDFIGANERDLNGVGFGEKKEIKIIAFRKITLT